MIGRDIVLQGQPFTIIGVTPRILRIGSGKAIDITVPLGMRPVIMPGGMFDRPQARWLRLMGRRRAGVSLPQVQAELASLWSRLNPPSAAPTHLASR